MLPELCLGLVMLGVTAYAVLGSADFGAGFWDLTAGGAERGGRVRGMIEPNATGNAVQANTRTKISQTWLASHTGLIERWMSPRTRAPPRVVPAVRSQKPAPKSALPRTA